MGRDSRLANRNNKGQTALELTAHLIREIELQPAALALVGATRLPSRYRVTDRRPKPLIIRAVYTDTDHLRAELLPEHLNRELFEFMSWRNVQPV